MINVINVEKFIQLHNLKGPVTSPQYFMGRTTQFHPQGLFSEEIFGMDGTQERRTSMSWIDLNCNVISPALYDIIHKRIEMKINKLLSGELAFSIDEEGHLAEDTNGEVIGFSKFVERIHDIQFRRSGGEEEETDRDKVIDMLQTNIEKDLFFINKLLVVSPAVRPVVLGEDQRDIMIDELNDCYRKIITLTNQTKNVSGVMYDVLSFKMQLAVKDLFELVKVRVAKKHGTIRSQMLGKRVDFSARAVITPNPKLRLGEVGVPLMIACSIFEPYLVYGLVNSSEAKKIPDEFYSALKEFLGKEIDLELGI